MRILKRLEKLERGKTDLSGLTDAELEERLRSVCAALGVAIPDEPIANLPESWWAEFVNDARRAEAQQ